MTPAPDPVLPTHADVLSALHHVRLQQVSLAQRTPLLDQPLASGLFIWARRPLAASRRWLPAEVTAWLTGDDRAQLPDHGLKAYRRLVALEKTSRWPSITDEPFRADPVNCHDPAA